MQKFCKVRLTLGKVSASRFGSRKWESLYVLFGAEHAVASVAQAWNDIAVIVEMAIDGGGEYLDIGVGFG